MSLRNIYGRAFIPLGCKGNPIRCDGAQGQHFYLDRLRDPNGNGIEYQRAGAAGQGPYGRLLDEYVIRDGGPLGRSLFLDMYHPGYSETKAPEGLFIVNYLSGKHDLKLPKDADFSEIERHAWRIAKAFKDDAKPLSTILRNAFTEEQCHQILVFAGALVVHDYRIKKDKFVSIVISNKKLALDHLLHRFGPELIRVLLAVAHKHLGHCHQLWQPDVYERLAGPFKPNPHRGTAWVLFRYASTQSPPRYGSA